MKNIRAIACVFIILGAVLVEVSYMMYGDGASGTADLIRSMLPALAGLILISHGAKALLLPPR